MVAEEAVAEKEEVAEEDPSKEVVEEVAEAEVDLPTGVVVEEVVVVDLPEEVVEVLAEANEASSAPVHEHPVHEPRDLRVLDLQVDLQHSSKYLGHE